VVDRHMKTQGPFRTSLKGPWSERSEPRRGLQVETTTCHLTHACFPVGHLGRREFGVWAVLAMALLETVVSVPRAAAQAASTDGTTDAAPERPATEPSVPALDTWGTDAKPEKDSPTAPVVPSQTDSQRTMNEAAPANSVQQSAVSGAEAEAQEHLRYTLERIEVRGNTRTRARVILRYLKFRPGDVIDVDDPELTLTRYRVLGTGFFRDVQFALRKGSRRGLVVLVVEVSERNTVVVNDVGMGLSSDVDNNGHSRLNAYGGADIAETNVAGSGITLGAAVAVAQEQTALRFRFLLPSFLGTTWMMSGTILRNKARDFFGTTSDVNWITYNGRSQGHSSNAVVDYTRSGGNLGFGRDLSTSTQFWLTYRLETIEAKVPIKASEDRGQGVVPIAFDIRRDRSLLSSVRATFQLDTRDHPFLPTRGWYATAGAELAMQPFGSDYGYQRFDVAASYWWQVRGLSHVLRLQMFAGAETGEVPFFEQYYYGDFTDFRAPRMFGLNFERRPPPNLFGTIIKDQRYGQYAAKLGLEYRIPLFRGSRSVYGIDLFLGAGLWGLINRRDLEKIPSQYTGFSRVPVDLTGNIGFRMDTSAGGITFAFSNILGFMPGPLHGDGS
jgi:outer membrane protein insertion porin family